MVLISLSVYSVWRYISLTVNIHTKNFLLTDDYILIVGWTNEYTLAYQVY